MVPLAVPDVPAPAPPTCLSISPMFPSGEIPNSTWPRCWRVFPRKLPCALSLGLVLGSLPLWPALLLIPRLEVPGKLS